MCHVTIEIDQYITDKMMSDRIVFLQCRNILTEAVHASCIVGVRVNCIFVITRLNQFKVESINAAAILLNDFGNLLFVKQRLYCSISQSCIPEKSSWVSIPQISKAFQREYLMLNTPTGLSLDDAIPIGSENDLVPYLTVRSVR